ncbi:MAG: RNase P subunit p30 family protein [archaeon]
MHVTTKYSCGVNTVPEVVTYAERLGFDTIVILDRIDSLKTLQSIKDDVGSLKTNVNVLVGVEIMAKNAQELHKMINRFRDNVDILAVHGGDIEINRSAVENPRVDLLTHPEQRRKDSGMDHVMMKLAAENNVAIELNFHDYLHSYRKIRSYVLNHMRNNVMLAEKYDTHVVVASGAESVWDMRAGRELASLAYICGLDREKAVKTVSDIPSHIIKRVAEIKSGNLKSG